MGFNFWLKQIRETSIIQYVNKRSMISMNSSFMRINHDLAKKNHKNVCCISRFRQYMQLKCSADVKEVKFLRGIVTAEISSLHKKNPTHYLVYRASIPRLHGR